MSSISCTLEHPRSLRKKSGWGLLALAARGRGSHGTCEVGFTRDPTLIQSLVISPKLRYQWRNDQPCLGQNADSYLFWFSSQRVVCDIQRDSIDLMTERKMAPVVKTYIYIYIHIPKKPYETERHGCLSYILSLGRRRFEDLNLPASEVAQGSKLY